MGFLAVTLLFSFLPTISSGLKKTPLAAFTGTVMVMISRGMITSPRDMLRPSARMLIVSICFWRFTTFTEASNVLFAFTLGLSLPTVGFFGMAFAFLVVLTFVLRCVRTINVQLPSSLQDTLTVFQVPNIGSTLIPFLQARNLRDLLNLGAPFKPFANMVSATSLFISAPIIGVGAEALACLMAARQSRAANRPSRSLAANEINLITATTPR